MIKQFVPCAPQNFLAGRKSFQPEAIVLHGMASLAEADALFQDGTSMLSSHYVIAADGSVRQYVEEADSAFHAGIVVSPTWSLLKRGVNPNFYTIGVTGAGEWTDVLYTRVAELVHDVATRWNIPIDADHLPVHSEIRSSKACPAGAFDRAKLLAKFAVPPMPAPRETTTVHLIAATNLRDGVPRTSARIVRTAAAGEDIEVIGFTDSGERVKGNNVWYQTSGNEFFWAGNTDTPQPVKPAALAPVPQAGASALGPAAVAAEVVRCGIPRIDDLFSGRPASPIGPAEPTPDRAAIGAVQDLLSGQGFAKMPNFLASSYGNFGAMTLDAVKRFQAAQQLPVTGAVDSPTLQALVSTPAQDPRITQAYLTLGLKLAYDGMRKLLAITAQMEGVGKFGAINRNTDKAGLSYGLIQWAQSRRRLPELLRAFQQADAALYTQIFGDGDSAMAEALIAHVSKPNGGVSSAGTTVAPKFDLVAEPWVGRFKRAALEVKFQVAQVATAMTAFLNSYRAMREYASDVRTERGVGFMLDVANQFGDGGLKRLYTTVRRPGASEMDILEEIAAETVEEINRKFPGFGVGVRARRDGFLNTRMLADTEVVF
jgi:peptidoglycan hydrolase-like protein with peptidoglycan-binding domain